MDWFPYVFGFVVVVGGGLIFIWWRSMYGVGVKDDKIDHTIEQPTIRRDPYNRQSEGPDKPAS